MKVQNANQRTRQWTQLYCAKCVLFLFNACSSSPVAGIKRHGKRATVLVLLQYFNGLGADSHITYNLPSYSTKRSHVGCPAEVESHTLTMPYTIRESCKLATYVYVYQQTSFIQSPTDPNKNGTPPPE